MTGMDLLLLGLIALMSLMVVVGILIDRRDP